MLPPEPVGYESNGAARNIVATRIDAPARSVLMVAESFVHMSASDVAVNGTIGVQNRPGVDSPSHHSDQLAPSAYVATTPTATIVRTLGDRRHTIGAEMSASTAIGAANTMPTWPSTRSPRALRQLGPMTLAPLCPYAADGLHDP